VLTVTVDRSMRRTAWLRKSATYRSLATSPVIPSGWLNCAAAPTPSAAPAAPDPATNEMNRVAMSIFATR
jgi:hypothetical protein